MTVRLKLALTIFATGLVTALLVIATVVYAFQRFENETAYQRGMGFLGRVVVLYDDIFGMHERDADEFQRWLRGLVLFEPDTELYLLALDGTVLAKTGPARLAPGVSVALAPVRESIEKADADYVMGDDPERMDAGAVIVAKPVRRLVPGGSPAVAGYLYLVIHTQQLPEGRWNVLRSSFARPVLGLVLAIVALTTLLAALIIAAVIRPLRLLTRAVSTLSERGLTEGLAVAPASPLPVPTRDEFGQLTGAFEMLLEVCRRQWNALRRSDHLRREGVSNLSHDLRSPLTATVACLETLEGRWSEDKGHAAERGDDRRLVEIALRNTRNAARMVQSLGDLAKLDEPSFTLRSEVVDAGELLDDIALRFAERASRLGVKLHAEPGPAASARGPRRRALRARRRQPRRQRAQVLPAGQQRGAERAPPGRPRRDRRGRRRAGHRRSRTAAAVRPLLPKPHHRGACNGRRRARPRPGDRQAHRRAAWRRSLRGERARPRHARRLVVAGQRRLRPRGEAIGKALVPRNRASARLRPLAEHVVGAAQGGSRGDEKAHGP